MQGPRKLSLWHKSTKRLGAASGLLVMREQRGHSSVGAGVPAGRA